MYATKCYHNRVKSRLYERFTRNGDRLLDIGCGKGGDLHKWEHRRLHTVIAVDVNPAFIREAKRRIERKRAMRTRVHFWQADAFIDDLTSGAPGAPPYDAVSCMFCLHYAARDESSIHRLCQNVGQSLRVGGVFFGICADGDRILQTGTFANDLVDVRIPPHGDGPWGRPYEFVLSDSIIAERNVEFVTQQSELVRVAAQYGLEPTSLADCAEWTTAEGRCFPNCVGAKAQSEAARHLSSLYFVFAFIKR